MDPRLAERNIVEYLYNALGGPSLLLGRSTVKVTNIFSHFLTLGVSADDLPELQHKLRRVAHVSSHDIDTAVATLRMEALIKYGLSVDVD